MTAKRTEKASRRSLDLHNPPSEGTRKSSVSTSSSSSSVSALAGNGDKKPNGSQMLMTSLKRLVGGGGNSNGSNNTANVTIDDELDGVQRGEGAPLSHPTASRARLPRRRLPSSQHLRHHNAVNNIPPPSTTHVVRGFSLHCRSFDARFLLCGFLLAYLNVCVSCVYTEIRKRVISSPRSRAARIPNTSMINFATNDSYLLYLSQETNLANGSALPSLERLREEDGDPESRTAKGRRMAPWVIRAHFNRLNRFFNRSLLSLAHRLKNSS